MKKIILFLFVFYTSSIMAEDHSMRRCMLLPVTDTAGNSLGFRVYEDIERYLKDKGWCEYVSSSEVIEVFSKYRERLEQHLSDPMVLKTVADRLKVGSIFKISLKYDVDRVEVGLEVVGENGVDIYLSEKSIVEKMEFEQISTTLTNWLELYDTMIPYDGRVIGVLGEQVTFTFPKNKRVSVGQEFSIKKLIKKRRHPLLKKIVEWENLKVAKGKIYNSSRDQSLGLVKVYMVNNTKLEVGDWVKLEKITQKTIDKRRDYSKFEEHKYGKLGELSLSLNISSHTTGTSAISGGSKFGGLIYGMSAEAEAWITREYFAMGEFTKRVGSLSRSSGEATVSETAQSLGVIKVAGGYKYLPMGYFYGPQVNGYAGWARYSYELDKSGEDGLGTNSLSGLIFGIGGNMPIQKGLRIFGSGELMPFPSFDDESSVHGSFKSGSSVVFEVGVHYQYSSLIKLLGSMEVINNSVKLKGDNSELSYRDTAFKVGGVFTF